MEITLLCQATKDGSMKGYRGPDRIEGNIGVATLTCTSWLPTLDLEFGKGGFKKQ